MPAGATESKVNGMADDTQLGRGLMQGSPPPEDAQVTLANWRVPPFNRWSFHNVRQVVPTAAIYRGAAATPFGRDPHSIERVSFHGPGGEDWTVGRMLPATCTDGFIVLQRGRVVAETYGAGQRPETPHIIFSVSKSVTGAVAGVLVERGRLDPEAPVTAYIPEAAGSAYGDCTVRHVLDMTVGIDFVEDYLDTTGDFARYRRATAWNPEPAGAEPLDLRSFLVTLKRDAGPHGKKFHYVSPNSDLLGWLLERASGQAYADLLSEALWRPMGAEFDAYVTVDRLGASRSAGGVCVTLRDLARFGELMRQGGTVEGRQVLPRSWINDILTKGDPEAWKLGATAGFLPGGRYRSQWYVTGNSHGAFCAIGIHDQWIYVDPEAEVVIAKHSSQPVPSDPQMDLLHLAAFDALARALEGRSI
jgi:CubicO group peptidase (beta-lactamase class C family)